MLKIRAYKNDDMQFLREMLFEAVFWSRPAGERPSLEEGLSYDYMKHILLEFGKREGDVCLVAEVEGEYAGAAFVRRWNDVENIRGYISVKIPVLVIGVADGFRRQGIGIELIEALKKATVDAGYDQISLCVTKTNIAYGLYVKAGFEICEDIGDSYNMVWKR